MLFTDVDLAAYMQVALADLNLDTTDLLAGLVEGLIVGEVGAVADPPPSGVRAVALEATARAYRNPDGLVSESIDDYTWRRDSSTPGAYLTGQEIRRLHVAVGGTVSRSVPLSPSWRVATDPL
ncbi:MAG TPA: hypothetical protein VFJ19_09355 [Nocardioidaceae bacterium]|nr:hypothetical protein [Nocardioidaceae bacterium]